MLPLQQLHSLFVLPMEMLSEQDCVNVVMTTFLPKPTWVQSPNLKHHNYEFMNKKY